jgi:hypothetical protein
MPSEVIGELCLVSFINDTAETGLRAIDVSYCRILTLLKGMDL